MSLWAGGGYRSVAVAGAIVCVVTFAVYGQLVTFDFVSYDDPYFITLNPHVMGGMTMENVLWSFSTSRMGIWHPLTWMTYQLELSVFGPDKPGAHHAVNLALHVLNAVLVLLLCWRLTGAVWASMLVAILFSIHPQHVQPVAWISERKEVLAALFFFLSLNFYAAYRFQSGRARYLLSLVAFGVALLCKPSVAPLPLILILVDLFFRPADGGRMDAPRPAGRRQAMMNTIRDKIPFLLLSAVVSVITIYIKKSGHWADYEETLHLGRRLLLMPMGLLHYVKTLFMPWPNPLWIEAPDGMPYLRSLVGTGVLCLLGIGIWRVRNRFPELVFGALWFVIMWLPVSGIVIVSNYYVADRYTYLPFVGAMFGLVFFGRGLFGSVLALPRAGIALALVVVSAGAVLGYKQTSYWRDSFTFFQRESEINPASATAPVFVGHALLIKRRYEAALEKIEIGLEMDNDQPRGHAFKARALSKLGRIDASIEAYREAIARGYSDSDAYAHLGSMLAERGDVDEAVELMENGLERFPDDVYLLNNLAYSYAYRLDRSRDARDAYARVLRLEPDNEDALLGLGTLQLREGEIKPGMKKLEHLLQIDPDNEPAREMIRAYVTE